MHVVENMYMLFCVELRHTTQLNFKHLSYTLGWLRKQKEYLFIAH